MRHSTNPRWIILCVFVGLAYFFMLSPISVVIIESFNHSEIMQFPPKQFSLRWFQKVTESEEFRESFLVSLKLGLITAAISTVAGTLAAYGLNRTVFGAGLETVLLAPLYVPRVLIGMSLLLALSRIYLSGSFLGMLFGHILITLPFVVRTVTVSIHGVDPAVEEASRSLGATWLQSFLRVTLPLISRGIVAGAIFAFVISFSDVYLALFIAGPDTITLPLRIFNFLEWEQSPIVAAASTVQVGMILATIIVAEKAVGLSSSGRI